MNICNHSRHGIFKIVSVIVSGMLLVLGIPVLVKAELGGTVDTVKKDLAHIKGTMRYNQTALYTVHEIVGAEGTIVREYVSGDGVVFGVAWQGHFMPDLQQLFGQYFQQYSDAVKVEKAKHTGRKPLHINKPGLVVHQFGHMRAYFGRAYIPGIIPAGVDVKEIK
jgi:hypothetical protein